MTRILAALLLAAFAAPLFAQGDLGPSGAPSAASPGEAAASAAKGGAQGAAAGGLGQLVFDDGTTIPLTQNDLLWGARLINGETWGHPKGRDGAAMLWTIAQRSYWRGRKETLAKLIPLYSQPINEKWARDGSGCKDHPLKDEPTKKGVKNPCSKEKLNMRDKLRTISWEKMSKEARAAATDFANCKLDNPLPGSIGWLATSIYGDGVDGGAKLIEDFNDNSYYASIKARTIGGKKRTTTDWDGTEVKVVCGDKTSGVAKK